MNQPITIAKEITPGQYFAALDGWRIANRNPDELEPPSAEWWEEQQERIKNNPHLTGSA